MTDYKALLEVLLDANVNFVVISGLAGNAHGAARFTQDNERVIVVKIRVHLFNPCTKSVF